MPSFEKSSHETKWIKVKFISVIWAQSQRGLNTREAKRIAEELDPDAFGTIQVTKPNGKGVYHCVDGQTRVAAVRMLWGEEEMVPCNILPVKDPRRAADIFTKINSGRSKPHAIELFHVAVTAGHEAEVAVNKLVTSLSYRVEKVSSSKEGTITAIGICLKVYHRFGLNTLRDVLIVIQGTWGMIRSSVDSSIISGYASILGKHRHIDHSRLMDRMKKDYSPERLIGAARGLRETYGGSIGDNVARVIEITYNHGLKSKKIGDEP